MAHRRECLCSASQLWLPHPALCIVPPECFRGLRVWSGAVGSKSSKLRNIADRDNMAAPATTEYHFQTVDIVTKNQTQAELQTSPSLIQKHQCSTQHLVLC